MDRFFKIALELGWKQIKDTMVFIKKEKDGYYSVNFTISDALNDFDLNDERIDKNFVKTYMTISCCSNKVKGDNLNWGIPLLLSDFYGHRRNENMEIYWAKKAIEQNPDLFPKAFPEYLAKKLD